MPEVLTIKPIEFEKYLRTFPPEVGDFLIQVQYHAAAYYARDLHWCNTRPDYREISSVDAFTEYAHVVYCSGLRAATVYLHWEELKSFWKGFDPVAIRSAHESHHSSIDYLSCPIKNTTKYKSILRAAKLFADKGIEVIREEYLSSIDAMLRLPYIGSITKYHLARNLGYDCVKPDMHLMRVADHYRMSPESICGLLSEATGWKLGASDNAVWRYCTDFGTLGLIPRVTY